MKQFDGGIKRNKSSKFITTLFVYLFQQLFYITINSKISTPIDMDMQSIDWMGNEQTVYPEIRTHDGSPVGIPCNITLSSSSDAVRLILWYKGSDISGSPIYSIDSRSSTINNAQHFISKSIESRAKVDLNVRPAVLRLDPVIDSDDGQYWCRVDFRWTRTAISVVTLSVIVPPISLMLKDINGKEMNDTINVDEYHSFGIICEAFGGKPLPNVKWYDSSQLIDDTYEPNKKSNTVRNELVLRNVSRNQLFSSFTCQTSSDNSSKTLSKTITIDINLHPLVVEIMPTIGVYLSSSVKTEVVCRTYGSRPSALIEWFISDNNVTHFSESFSGENYTQSVLKFTPHWSQNNEDLICRAKNFRLPEFTIEDVIVLDIRFEPILTLFVGNDNKTYSRFREGSEIVLNCIINSYPKASVVRWTHNSLEVWNQSYGIITSNTTLIIKSANRQHEGRYQCLAFNSMGRGVSNDIRIGIDYSPICLSETKSYSIRIGEKLDINCEIDAKPDNLTYFWTINNIVNNNIKSHENFEKSLATFRPLSESDFGLIRCWARNEIGFQSIPCLFNVSLIEPVVPHKVTNCSIETTIISISIDCIPGVDGSSGQSFRLDVYDSRRKHLLESITNTISPSFIVTNLTSGTTFVLIITAFNIKGNSPDITLIGKTNSTKISIQVPLPDTNQPIIMLLIAICASLIILIAIVYIISKLKFLAKLFHLNRTKQKSGIEFESKSTVNYSDDDSVQNPDVIPNYSQNSINHINKHVVCNGNAVPIVSDFHFGQNSIHNSLCNSSAYNSKRRDNSVKFMTTQLNDKIFNDEELQTNNLFDIKNQKIVVATIETHPLNQKYLTSYSTPV